MPTKKEFFVFFLFIFIIFIISLFEINPGNIFATDFHWKLVGNAGFSGAEADYISLAIDNKNIPYVAYKDAGNSSSVSVMKYDGGWIPVGDPGFSGAEADYISLAIDNKNIPYVAYKDAGNSSSVSVMKYDGGWIPVGDPGFSGAQADYISLAIDKNDIPYVAYKDAGNSSSVSVMKYDGGWTQIGDPGFSGAQADYISLAIDKNDIPYVAYKDAGNSRSVNVMMYDDGWIPVGDPGFSGAEADYISLAIDNKNIPYVAYKDAGNSSSVSVMKYDGGWTQIGDPGFSGAQADYISLAIDKNDIPYVAYKDAGNKNSVNVMMYDDGWIPVGDQGFSGAEAGYISLAIDNNNTYVAYKDAGNSNSVSVMKYYDIIAPTIIGLSDNTTPRKTKVWTWRANETSTYRYSIDQNPSGVPSGAYSSVQTANQSGDGTYYIHVQARDSYGNESEVTTVYGTISSTAPEFGVEITNGAWCWFADPRAVRYEGIYDKLYIGWVDKDGNVGITSYDYDLGEFDSFTLNPNFQIDDHDNPTIFIKDDGRLQVFYSKHSATGNAMYYRISTNPEDISSWESQQTIGVNTPGIYGYTYPVPIQLDNESNLMYLFWRGGDMQPAFATSTNGTSWNNARKLISADGTYPEGYAPYIKYVSNDADEIHFTYTDNAPNLSATSSIYYAYYKNGNFYKADDTPIKDISNLPLVKQDLDLVYDGTTTNIKSWIWDIALDSLDRPVIVYTTFPGAVENDHRYRYAYWNGTAWIDNEITPAGGSMAEHPTGIVYSGGIILNHSDPSIVYLSKYSSGQFEIQKWSTSDHGENWSSENITTNSSYKNVRPFLPYGSTSDDDLLWLYGSYYYYTDYDTNIMINATSINDNTEPIITILGSNPVSVYRNSAYSDDGATANDNIDGDITNSIQTTSNVNTNTIGSYTVTYVVSDSAGNTSTSTRTVNVINRPGGGIPVYMLNNSSNNTELENNLNIIDNSTVSSSWISGIWVKTSDDKTVYFVDSNNIKYMYPDQGTWESYYGKDFSNVKIISKQELSDYSYGGIVSYKEGSLIKTSDDSKVYKVSDNKILNWIVSENVAQRLFGNLWNKIIHDINSIFFSDYTIGNNIE